MQAVISTKFSMVLLLTSCPLTSKSVGLVKVMATLRFFLGLEISFYQSIMGHFKCRRELKKVRAESWRWIAFGINERKKCVTNSAPQLRSPSYLSIKASCKLLLFHTFCPLGLKTLSRFHRSIYPTISVTHQEGLLVSLQE